MTFLLQRSSLLLTLVKAAFCLLLALQIASFAPSQLWLGDIAHELSYQLLLCFALSALVFIRVRPRYWLLMAVIGLGINLFTLAPLYRPSASHCPTCVYRPLTIVQFNAFYKNAKTADLVRWANAQNDIDIIMIAEAGTNMPALVSLKTTYPYSTLSDTKAPDIALFSKRRLTAVSALELLPASLSKNAYAIKASVMVGPKQVDIIAIHPPYKLTRDSRRQHYVYLHRISQLIARASGTPTVMVGDFNTSQWNPALRNLSDDAALHSAQLGRGLTFTWHPIGWPAWLTGLMIDHAYVSNDIQVVDRHIVDGDFGSDHLPVFNRLSIPVGK